MQTITTKYHGATNTRGSRISATNTAGLRVSIPYPIELSGDACHDLAAKTLCEKFGWKGELISGGQKTGNVYVFLKTPLWEADRIKV
jgi:hypothetical protein